eukprot:3166140-Prymnesium_polylepis.1
MDAFVAQKRATCYVGMEGQSNHKPCSDPYIMAMKVFRSEEQVARWNDFCNRGFNSMYPQDP